MTLSIRKNKIRAPGGELLTTNNEEGYAGEFFEPEDVDSLAAAISRVIDNPERRRELGMRNFLASRGLPIGDVVDWYLLHMVALIDQPKHGNQPAMPESFSKGSMESSALEIAQSDRLNRYRPETA